MMLVSLSEPCYVKTLSDLPERIHAAGVVNTGTHIYVMGGVRYVDGKRGRSKKVDRLCLMSNEWETCYVIAQSISVCDGVFFETRELHKSSEIQH